MNKVRTKVKTGVLLLIVLFTVSFFWEVHQNEINREYFQNLDLKLTGIVTNIDCPENFNGFCIIDVKILSSNISYYDPRNKLKYYYCLIKNNIAQIYQCGGPSALFVDGTIKIDTYKETVTFSGHDVGYLVPDMRCI